MTEETRELLEVVDLAQSRTFDSMLAQVLDAFALKVGELFEAHETRVYLMNDQREELFSLGSNGAEGPREIRVSRGEGIVGRVADSGVSSIVEDTRADPEFSAPADPGSLGDRLLVVPLADSRDDVFGVLELARPSDAKSFTSADEARLRELTRSLSTVLETWFRMSCSCRANRGLASTRSCD